MSEIIIAIAAPFLILAIVLWIVFTGPRPRDKPEGE